MTDDKLSDRAATAAMGIAFAAARTSLGTVLVASRAGAVCAILLGDSEERLARELGAIFPDAPCEMRRQALGPELAAVVALAERPWMEFEPPLAIGGTPFQEKVWAALREIPAGATVSYAEIARRIGAPSALRAVAARLRRQCSRHRHSLSSRPAQRRQPVGLSLGSGAKTHPDRARKRRNCDIM